MAKYKTKAIDSIYVQGKQRVANKDANIVFLLQTDIFTNKDFTQVLKCLSALTLKLFVEQIMRGNWS